MQKKGLHFSALFFYFLASILMTFPLILHFSSVMPGNGGDEYLMTWFFYEFYHSAFVLHAWPYYTHMVYYPHGAPLYITTSMPVNQAAAAVIYFFSKNWFLAFNIIFLISCVLNGYFAYLLALDATESAPASFIAGFIFAFSPILTEQARWGDLNIWSAYGLPLYIIFFNRMFKEPSAKNALLAALGLFLATYAGFYEYTAMLLAYSLFFIIYNYREIISADAVIKGRYIKAASVMTGVFVLVSSVFLIPAIYYIYIMPGIVNYNPSLYWTEGYSSTVSAFFLPPFFDKILLPFTLAAYFNPFYKILLRGANSQDFLGYIPLVFFAAAVIYGFKSDKKIKFYTVSFLVFALMSLSPLVHIVNNIRVFDPFVYIVDLLPVFKEVEESGRYMIPGFLFFGIVSAFGIKSFLGRFKTKAFYALIFLLIFLGTAAGYTSYPFEAVMNKIPGWVYVLKKDRSAGAVMYNPPLIAWGFPMYGQTVYRKPMAGGFVIRFGFHNLYKKYLPERLYEINGIRYAGNGVNQLILSKLGNPTDFKKNFKYFKRLGIRYIIICKGCLQVEYGWSKKRAKNALNALLRKHSDLTSVIYNGKKTLIIKFNYQLS